MLVCHWPGIYYNGQETGFTIFKEVVRRLHARYDHLIWMKLSEISRYWAARELTEIRIQGRDIRFQAPFACPGFTLQVKRPHTEVPPKLTTGRKAAPLRPASHLLSLEFIHDCQHFFLPEKAYYTQASA